MTCTRNTLRCANARSYSDRLNECCRSHVIQIVRDMAPLLDEAGVTWWADYGTLLGAVRNPLTTWADYPWLKGEGPIAGGIIPHDKDSDFGVLFSDYKKVLGMVGAMQRKGYSVLVRPGERMIKVRLSNKNTTNMDIFFWREAPDRWYRPKYIAVDSFKGRDIPKDKLFPLTTVEWEGLTLPAPKDPESFCAFRYGPNWRTPVMANTDGVPR
jgi:phosphorylcholine metabolism protein LicD